MATRLPPAPRPPASKGTSTPAAPATPAARKAATASGAAARAALAAMRDMSPEEARAFDKAPAGREAPAALSAEERRLVDEAVDTAGTLIFNGLLHRLDRQAYPIARDATALERSTAQALGELDDATFHRLLPGVSRLLSDAQQRKRFMGRHATVDVHKADVGAQLRSRLRAGSTLSLAKRLAPLAQPEEEPRVLRRVVKATAKAPAKKAAGGPGLKVSAPQGPVYTQAMLMIRALHCLQTTSGMGDDDMVLGGVLLEVLDKGITAVPARSLVCGTFAKSQRRSYGERLFGVVSLRSKPQLPRTFFACFLLVESDRDDQKVANGLSKALGVVAGTVASLFGGAAAGVAVTAVVEAIGKFIALFISDDHFPPYEIRVRQDGTNDFWSTGNLRWQGPDGPDMRTEDITGHGGRYRIGYKWGLS